MYLTDMGPEGQGWKSPELSDRIARAADLADRIEALLPPEDIPVKSRTDPEQST